MAVVELGVIYLNIVKSQVRLVTFLKAIIFYFRIIYKTNKLYSRKYGIICARLEIQKQESVSVLGVYL